MTSIYTTNTNQDLNQTSEEEFELYKDEAEYVDLDPDEDDTLVYSEGFRELASLRGVVGDLSSYVLSSEFSTASNDACASYIPNISDFNHLLNYALRWGYYGLGGVNGNSIQSVRLGPQLLVRKNPSSVRTLPINEELFTEFWLDAFADSDFDFDTADEFDDADADDVDIVRYRPSPALQKIKTFLDRHEGDFTPIPEDLLAQARVENPDAITKPFRDFSQYGGHANSKTPKELRLNLKLVALLPETIKELSKVLEQAVDKVENSFSRMSPSSHLGAFIAPSKAIGRETSGLSGIASLSKTTTPKQQNA